MAATRLITMHINKGKTIAQSHGDRTDYAINPDKTQDGEYVSSYKCSPETVDAEFLLSKQKYSNITGRKPQHGRDIIAYQIRQSFLPGEVTPEQANKIGYELAMRFTGGQHQFIVATHIDKAHVHNHIIFNSTTLDCTHKFNNYKDSAEVVRDVSKTIFPLSRIPHRRANIMPSGKRNVRVRAGKRNCLKLLTNCFLTVQISTTF